MLSTMVRDFQRQLKRQQPQSDAKSDAKFAAIVQFLACHFTVVAFSRSLHDSAKVVISRLLARNCRSLAVVVSAVFASRRWPFATQRWPGGEVVISRSLPLWGVEVDLGHSKVVVSWLLYFHVLFRSPPNGAVTPGPSRECDINFFVKGRPKSAQQLRDSTVAAHRSQSVTVPSSQVTRECRSPRLRSP